VIGASTGGPSAIGEVVRGLSADLPVSVFIAQHMPAGFTKSFAERLHRSSELDVVEASDGLGVTAQCAYVAPGDAHMVLEEQASRTVVRLLHTPPVNGVRPSIDVLMKSVAELGGADVVGVLLTGMGHDGAEGLSQIKAAGGWTIAQDRDSSTIFGMPRAAIRLGVVDKVAPVTEIAALVAHTVMNKASSDD
jgi:two-component system chemotaxis response regulator CheB